MATKHECRTISGAQLRAEQSASTGKRVVRGRAASYGIHTVIGAGSRGAFREVILPGAFKAPVARMDDCRLTLNHSSDLVYGRVGRNLTLREAKDGLYFECALLDSTMANDFYVSVKAQIFDQCSFAFSVDQQNWNDDAPCDCCGENSTLPLRELAAVRLFDVAVVDRPQYSGTSAAAGTVVEDLSANDDEDDDPEGTDWLEQSSVRVSVEARRHAAQLVEQRAKSKTPCKKPRFANDEERHAAMERITAELDADRRRRLDAATKAIRGDAGSEVLSEVRAEMAAEAQANLDRKFAEDVANTRRDALYMRHPSKFPGGSGAAYLDWLANFLRS